MHPISLPAPPSRVSRSLHRGRRSLHEPGPERLGAHYNRRMRLSGRSLAIDAAAKAIAAGDRVKWSYAQDSDLASIREDGRFKALVAGL